MRIKLKTGQIFTFHDATGKKSTSNCDNKNESKFLTKYSSLHSLIDKIREEEYNLIKQQKEKCQSIISGQIHLNNRFYCLPNLTRVEQEHSRADKQFISFSELSQNIRKKSASQQASPENSEDEAKETASQAARAEQ